MLLTKQFLVKHYLRILILALLFLAAGSSAVVVQELNVSRALSLGDQELAELQGLNIANLTREFGELKTKTADYKSQGVDVASVEAQFAPIETAILDKNGYGNAKSLLTNAGTELEALKTAKLESDKAAAEALANVGTVTGKVTEGTTNLASVTVSLYAGSTQVVKSTSATDGSYALSAAAGSYTLQASKSGYSTYRKYNVVLKAKETVTADLSLTKAVAAPATTSSGAASTANSSYIRKTVSTNRGDFLVDVMTFNLGNGGVKVYTSTANENDCSDNCPVKSLSSYVAGHGGFAGINGTYFCPADYSSCAGKINTFFWKVRNTILNKTINANNGMGEIDPYMTFGSSGSASYYHAYTSGSPSPFAGINSWPRLIEGGANVLNTGELDSKQLSTKSNRGALGLKGQTLYAVIAKSATVPDLAAVMSALGVDNAMNIDGGGSSAMYYNGYKVGPGRSLPNAVIFVGG